MAADRGYLCEIYSVKGRQGHDARLVAWMHINEISQIFTLNSGDFSRYEWIEVLSLAT
jgi:hypothetical protein